MYMCVSNLNVKFVEQLLNLMRRGLSLRCSLDNNRNQTNHIESLRNRTSDAFTTPNQIQTKQVQKQRQQKQQQRQQQEKRNKRRGTKQEQNPTTTTTIFVISCCCRCTNLTQ